MKDSRPPAAGETPELFNQFAAERLRECELEYRAAQRSGSSMRYKAAIAAYQAAEQFLLQIEQRLAHA